MIRPLKALLAGSLFALAASSMHHQHEQQVMRTLRYPRPMTMPSSSSYLDPSSDSVALVLETVDQPVRLWLPLRQSVYTRTSFLSFFHNSRDIPSDLLLGDAPELPLHPFTAELVTIATTSIEADGVDLDSVVCKIWPRAGKTADGVDHAEPSAIEIRRVDGRVQLEVGALAYWLGGREVEAYECA